MFSDVVSSDSIRYIIIAMLITSICLDLICWFHRGASTAFFYLECLQTLIETFIVPNEALRQTLIVAIRFAAANVFLSVEARSSIIFVTLTSWLTMLIGQYIH